MNERERWLETLLFGKPDKIPFVPGSPRESTLRLWRQSGLSEDADWYSAVQEHVGIERPRDESRPNVWIRHTMIPEFEEKIIEERRDHLIVQDWKGNICEISNQFDVSYLRSAKDFVTRRWIKCPVETRDDWEAMKGRYDPDDPARVPENLESLGAQLVDRQWVVGVHVHGPFWQMREWMGFEGLCMAFMDNPELVRDMVQFWTDYISRLLAKVTRHITLDYFHISEDMAYKHKAMISPDMTREYLAPCYRQWGELLRENNCPIYAVDSDGFVGELIPVWIECGINCCDPLEVAAGNDMNEFRKAFGRKMAFRGGIDKRAIAKGGQTIRDELARVEAVVRDGGYIPSCDHGIPPDVGWREMLDYCELLAEMTGWK